MATTRYHGKNGRIALAASGTGNRTTVASINAWTLNKSVDYAEVTSFGDANKTYVAGLPDLSGTASGFWDSADTAMLTASDSTAGVPMILYPSTTAGISYFYGDGFIDYSINVPVSGAVTFTANFKAAGSWSRTGL